MKNGLTILIAAMVLSISFSGVASAIDSNFDVEAGSTLKIIGVGTMDRELLAQSGWGYEGQKLTESTYTKWMGTDGLSNIDFSSNLDLFIGKSDEHEDTNVTEISYAQTSGMTNMRSTVCSRNFDAGIASGFSIVGTSVKAFEIAMYPDSNELVFEGAINGSARLRHVVVDPVTKLKVIKELTDLEGEFNIDWNAFGDRLTYPGDEGDWLGCP